MKKPTVCESGRPVTGGNRSKGVVLKYSVKESYITLNTQSNLCVVGSLMVECQFVALEMRVRFSPFQPYADVLQLVEGTTDNRDVTGSIPVIRTNLYATVTE